MKKQLLDKLHQLQEIEGISGQEQQVVRFLRDKLEPLVDEFTIDTFGNIIALKKGLGTAPSLMVAAHTDEIGAMVKSIEISGFLRFNKVGGTIDALLIGRKVNVGGHLGLVGAKAGHIQSPIERNKVISSNDMYIDVGAKSKEEVLAMGIGVGTPITYISEISYFANRDLLCGKALDDRLGCAILWQLLEDLQGKSPKGDLYMVFTVQEEVGLRGATVVTHRVNPDYAIALDTIPSGDTPDTVTDKELPIRIGEGPVIPIVSGGGVRGNYMHPGMRKMLETTAQRHAIPVQIALFSGGTSDASAIHMVRDGILTGAITIPRRYSHSAIEMLDINDALSAYKLLEAIINEMEQHKDISFLD